MLKLSPGQEISLNYDINVMSDETTEFQNELKRVLDGDRAHPFRVEGLKFKLKITNVQTKPNFEKNALTVILTGLLV